MISGLLIIVSTHTKTIELNIDQGEIDFMIYKDILHAENNNHKNPVHGKTT